MLKAAEHIKFPRKVRRELAKLYDDGVGRYTVFERENSLDVFTAGGDLVVSVGRERSAELVFDVVQYLREHRLGFVVLYLPDSGEHVRVHASGRFEIVDLPPDPSPLVDLGSRVVTKREALAAGAGVIINSQSDPTPISASSAGASLPQDEEEPDLIDIATEADTDTTFAEPLDDPVPGTLELPVVVSAENPETGETPCSDATPVVDPEIVLAVQMEQARLEAEVECQRLADAHAEQLARVVDTHNQQVARLEAEVIARLRDFEVSSQAQESSQVKELTARLGDLEQQLEAAQHAQAQAQTEFEAVVAQPHVEDLIPAPEKRKRSRTLAALVAGGMLVAGGSASAYYMINTESAPTKTVTHVENARDQALLNIQTRRVFQGELQELIDSTPQILETYQGSIDLTVEFRLAIEDAKNTVDSRSLLELDQAITALKSAIDTYRILTRTEEAEALAAKAKKTVDTAGTRVRSDTAIPEAQAAMRSLETAIEDQDLEALEKSLESLETAENELSESHAEWKRLNAANQAARAEREAAARQAEHSGSISQPSGSQSSRPPASSSGIGSSPAPTPAPVPAPAPSGRVTGISGSGSSGSGSPGATSFSVTVSSSGTVNTSVVVTIGGKSVTLGSGAVNGSRTFTGSISGLPAGSYAWTATAGAVSFSGSAITVY